jgi:hypothetical protein
MEQLSANLEDVLHEREARALISHSRDVWPVCGVGIGLVGGVLAPLLGALLTAAAWMEGNGGYGLLLHKLGTFSFWLTIPLLSFGSHCMDVLEKRGWKLG